MLGVEEIGGAQMGVAPRLAGIYADHVHRDRSPRLGYVLVVDLGINAERDKGALDCGDQHVPHGELETAVS